MPDLMTIHQLCQRLHKSKPYVRTLQSKLELPVSRNPERYDDNYRRFLQKIIALRTFSIPFDLITELFGIEKKMLMLMHADSMTDSPTWYLECCSNTTKPEHCLLLTNYELENPIRSRDVQIHLNFRKREGELFAGSEMGEDIQRVIDRYLELVDQLKSRMNPEYNVLCNALDWANAAFPHGL